jgi:hypothetical protein
MDWIVLVQDGDSLAAFGESGYEHSGSHKMRGNFQVNQEGLCSTVLVLPHIRQQTQSPTLLGVTTPMELLCNLSFER